jgi:hypothetical protein
MPLQPLLTPCLEERTWYVTSSWLFNDISVSQDYTAECQVSHCGNVNVLLVEGRLFS